LVIGVCAVALVGEWKGLSSKGPFDGVLTWLKAGALVVVLVLTYVADRRDARAFPSRWPYATFMLAGAALISFAGIRAWGNHLDSLPCSIRAGQFQDFNGTSLDLLLNGDYRYCDVGIGETCCSGTWRMSGDTILLASGEGCRQGTLVIRECSADASRKCLCWLHEQHMSTEMWILDDSRPR
jgi:hypothetical protein